MSLRSAGNTYLAELTSTANATWTLCINLYDWEGNTASAIYDNFVVGGADTDYTLTSLGKYSGTAGQSHIPNQIISVARSPAANVALFT